MCFEQMKAKNEIFMGDFISLKKKKKKKKKKQELFLS